MQQQILAEIVIYYCWKTLPVIICGKIEPESIISLDAWRGYNRLVDLVYKKHYRVKYRKNGFANGKKRNNGTELIRAFAQRGIMKFHNIPKIIFYLRFKEYKFRFNYQNQNIYQRILKILRNYPLS